MDFSFRTFYQRKPSCSNTSSLSQQANQCDMESYNGGRFDKSLEIREREMMEREMMKERIRREILEEEAARRRELEEEVRREILMEREMKLRERERVLELRERELELRERGRDHWEPFTSSRYVARGLYERRVTLPDEERMYDFPRLEWEKKVGGNEEELPVEERMHDFPRLGWKEVARNEEELPLQLASQSIRTQVQSSSDVFKSEEVPPQPAMQQTKTVLRTNSDIFKMNELPFQRASQPYKAEVLKNFFKVKQQTSQPTELRTSSDIFKAKELPFQRASQPYTTGVLEKFFKVKQEASQTNKAEVKTSSDAVKVKELSFQRPYKTEVKTSSDVVKVEKKQNIFLGEPDANHSGNKRKDMVSPVEGPSEFTKKPAYEWSCALCQISATSELGLQEHLKGKKHKSKSKLAGQRKGMIGIYPEKIIDPLNISQVGERNVELEESQQTSNETFNISQVGEKTVELEESQQISNEPLNISQVGKKYVELEKSQQTSNDHETGVGNNNNSIAMKEGCGAVQKMHKNKIMNFRFYCEMCEVGTFCEETMNSHKKGKKHLSVLH